MRILLLRLGSMSAKDERCKLLLRKAMKRKNIKWIVGGILLIGLGGLIAYQFSGGREYSTDMNALRSQFSGDKGKVRLLVLLAPT